MDRGLFALIARSGFIAALSILAALAGCKREDVRSFQGVTEVEYVRLAAPHSGNLATLSVKPGTRVSEGTPVFSVVQAEDASAHQDAAERLAQLQKQRKGASPDAKSMDSLNIEVAEAQWKLSQKSANSPADGVVVETLFAKGDWVPAGAPVVAILPVDKIKVRFAVPLEVAAHLQHGRSVTLVCEGCSEPVDATIIYVSPFAFADGEKDPDALRYTVEARPAPDQAAMLKPGRPVTVIL
ncbi:MAG TPA: HlyD family efflux transporter periplasmic adaptor subunit [Burkholderiales bacterium]|nr:HlyD family efflux transporter periplasmic adaptor subunit [Burkholderiales bacterium]